MECGLRLIPKVRYFEGWNTPKVRYSEGLLFRRFDSLKIKLGSLIRK